MITGLITVYGTFEIPAIELTVTFTMPVAAPLGTTAVIDEFPQFVIEVAVVPSKVRVLPDCEDPKFDPVTVTVDPSPPKAGETPVTKGVVPTVTFTLSKVAVALLELFRFARPSPI